MRVTLILCTCGSTLMEKMDFEKLGDAFSNRPFVKRVLMDNSLCERNSFEKLGLEDDNRIVVAACSNRLLEAVFKNSKGPSLVEFVNIREQCAWACRSREEATLKATRLINGAVRKILHAAPPRSQEGLKIVKEALVIGGGIAGVRCALDIAEAGYRVYLVEREPSIGGVMAQLDKTFPTLDCSICMPGDSEVILHDGTITTLGELVDKLLNRNRASRGEAFLTYSYNSHSLKWCEIVSAQKLVSPKTLIEVKTSAGAKLRFTPDHKILVDYPEGPVWIECRRLKVGDTLYSPRKLDVKKSSREWIIDLLPGNLFKVADISLNKIIRSKLKEKFTTLRNASLYLNIRYDILQKAKCFLSIDELKKACEAAGLDWAKVRRRVEMLTYQGAGGKFRLKPRFLDEKLMYLLGLIASDGCIETGRIRFYNTNKQLIKLFLKNYKEIFPTKAACLTYLRPRSPNQKKRTVEVKNKLLIELARVLKVKKDLRPVFRLNDTLVASFMRGFFDGDGYVEPIRGSDWVTAKVTFSLGDEYEYGYGLHLLLKRLGILSKMHEYENRVVVDISGGEDILRFIKKVGSNHPKKSLRLRRIARTLRLQKSSGMLFEEMPLECGRLISNLKQRYSIPLTAFPLAYSNMIRVIRQKCRITRKNLDRIVKAVKRIVDKNDPDFIKLRGILKTEFFLDKVKELRIVPSIDDYVYDITVDSTHCFIPKGAFVVSNCIEGPLLSEAGRNRNISIIPNAEVVEVKGMIGDFKVKIRVNPTYVDPDKCNGCGECANVCPVRQPNKYDVNLKPVKAIYCPFAQAVPLKYVINREYCIECGLCMKACTRAAINLEDEPKSVELNVGAIVVAVGSDLLDPRLKPEYHYGEYENVITNMEFERIICASGPTSGVLLKRNGEPAKRIAFIQCVGSRESGPGIEECSYYCCAASMKEARLVLEHDRGAKVFIFYNELRAFGKGWEDLLYRRCLEDGIVFIRSRPSEVKKTENGNLLIVYEDTLTGRRSELEVDMVVLALGFKPSKRMVELAEMLGLTVDKHGFIEEAHAKMKPLETRVRGIFVAGTCHGPRDIVESTVEGSGAAALVTSLFRRNSLKPPEVAEVSAEKCTSCGRCLPSCEYGAIVREGDKVRVLENICNGCGACLAACPQEAITLGNWGMEQLVPQVSAILED